DGATTKADGNAIRRGVRHARCRSGYVRPRLALPAGAAQERPSGAITHRGDWSLDAGDPGFACRPGSHGILLFASSRGSGAELQTVRGSRYTALPIAYAA